MVTVRGLRQGESIDTLGTHPGGTLVLEGSTVKRSSTLTAGVAAVAMTGSLLTGLSTASATPTPVASGGSGDQSVRQIATPKSGGDSLVQERDVNGRAHSVRPDAPLSAPSSVRSRAASVDTDNAAARSVAKAQLKRVAPYFGARPADMTPVRTVRDDTGATVKFQQKIDGVPVFGGEIITDLDGSGALQSASGEVALSTYGSFPQDATAAQSRAADAARASVAKRIGEVSKGKITASASDLQASLIGPRWFDLSLMTDQQGSIGIPVYLYEVSGADGQRWQAMVHAGSGRTLLAWDVNKPLNRLVCDADHAQIQTGGEDVRCGDGMAFEVTRGEGDDVSDVRDVNRVYNYFGDTSTFYEKFGVDLTELIGADYGDGRGKALRGTVRICAGSCPYLNAFWNGEQMAFGEGVTTDDVTGHELTHGVTERRTNLAYLWESGAINESLSDIFGEFVDLSNGSSDDTTANRWLIGEGSDLGAIRSLKDPTEFGDPDRMRSANWFDDEYFQDNGGVHFNSGVGNKAGYLTTDGGFFNGQRISGLGLNRSAKLWFKASGLLTSGADYGDLAEALRSACTDLRKHSKGFTKNDCQQVEKVIKATEMDFEPTIGKPAQAPVCEKGEKKKKVWKTSFAEYPDGKVVADPEWVLSSTQGDLGAIYSKDGNDSLFTLLTGDESGNASTSSVQTANAIKIKKKDTYLRFTHAYNFYNVFIIFAVRSGTATMDYSTDGGATWQSAEDLPWVNGPTVDENYPDEGKAWHGNSGGWETSRVDLTDLRNRKVKFRWNAHASDLASIVPGAMWIDNAEVYRCK